MDVEFMVTDSLEAIRPKMTLLKIIEDAASAVDEMFASTIQGSSRGYLRLRVHHVILIPTPTQLMLAKAVVMIAVTRVNALPKMTRKTRMRTMPELSILQLVTLTQPE
jgi:hypothetical protein